MGTTVEVKGGTVVFFGGYLLHRSHRNRSNGLRRAVVPVGTDPCAWKGYAEQPQWVFLRRYEAAK